MSQFERVKRNLETSIIFSALTDQSSYIFIHYSPRRRSLKTQRDDLFEYCL